MDALTIAKELKNAGINDRISVGLRGLYPAEQLGDLRCSHVWDDGARTDEMLPGTCVISIGLVDCRDSIEDIAENLDRLAEAVELVKGYARKTKRVGLVIGRQELDCVISDYREAVLSDATCVAVWEIA